MINETFRLSRYFEKDYEFTYYRTERGAEVDLIIETPRGQKIAIEIKGSQAPHLVDFESGLRSFSTLVKSAKRICVCDTPRAYSEGSIEVLP